MANIMRPTSFPQPQRLRTGSITVGLTATAGPNVPVAPGQQVLLYCPPTNTASVFVGDADVTPTTGLEIEPGGSALIAIANLNKLYFVAPTAGQVVKYACESS